MCGGGGGGVTETFKKIINPVKDIGSSISAESKRAVDKITPEHISMKDINEDLTPEWAKEAGLAMGLSYGDMGLKTPEIPSSSADIKQEGVPKIEDAASAILNKVSEKRRAIARSRSIYTTPLGLGNIASVAKKFLLGE